MLVIENCNSLSDLRQKLIDGEEVRTARDKPCEDAIRREDAINAVSEALEHVFVENEDVARKMMNKLTSVNSQPKTGHWVYKIYGEFHEQGDWYCSHCDYQYNYGNGHAKFCPECGYEMSEPPTEEVIGDRDYDWVIKR